MKRTTMLLCVALTLALASPAAAFHHVRIPATACAADAAGSPSNNNGMAKEALTGQAGLTLPLAPVGTPGNGQGQGGEHCASASAE